MRHILFLCGAALLLMGNAVNVSTGPRLLRPRAIEAGVPLTVAEGETFLEADVLVVDYLTLAERYTFRHLGLDITLPEGTLLANYELFRRKESDPVVPVYCSDRLVRILGGKDRLPPGMDRRMAPTYALCFQANGARDRIERVFIAGGAGDYAGTGAFDPVRVVHGTTPRETGTVAGWELNDIWGSSGKPLAKMVTRFAQDEDNVLGGQRIIWVRGEAKGEMSALIAVGTKEARLPAALPGMFGVYDITVTAIDTKAKTLTYRIDSIHQPAIFIDRQGMVVGGYNPIIVVVPGR